MSNQRFRLSVFFAAIACIALSFLGTVSAQTTTPTSQQLDILKDMPAEQREALMNQVLGTGKSSVDKRDRKLQFPETTLPRTIDDLERQNRKETPFGEL